MKKIKFLNGINAMFALAVVALATTFTSCEKEEFNVDVTPVNAQAVISPIVLAIQNGVTTDVTSQATITPSELSFTGNPTLAAKSVDVTATYEGLSATVKVNVPALQAGQFASVTPTIILQEEDAETKIVAVPQKPTIIDDSTPSKEFKNYELYWYFLPQIRYTEKSGSKIVEGSEKINTEDLIERAAITSFFNTLGKTYQEKPALSAKDKYRIYANSMTVVSINYVIEGVEYRVVRQAATKAESALGSIQVANYTTTFLTPEENVAIPGHGHSHGHGHGHGGDYNAGGGIVDFE